MPAAGGMGSEAGPAERRPGQAVTGCGALKIETWASSGSMTVMIFWSARRWTHDPQLSK
jgi:hypothetical protein